MTAEDIARALGARRTGGSWMARCPVHEDHKPSLAIAAAPDGKVLVRCHAGCEQRDVIEALRAHGIWEGERQYDTRLRHRKDRYRPADADADARERIDAALRIWRASRPAGGTPVATYLRSRGITISPPWSIRYHARLKHPSGAAWPVMVALVTRGVDGEPIGVHRTFLAHGGNEKALVAPAKMMLGPCRGGAVRLGWPSELLLVGEGIETCLAAMQASGHAAWAALSTSGMAALALPPIVTQIIVLADHDVSGAGERAAFAAAQRWLNEGRRVRIALPPLPGADMADVLVGRTAGRLAEAGDVAV